MKKLIVYEICKSSKSFDKRDVVEMFEYYRVKHNVIRIRNEHKYS